MIIIFNEDKFNQLNFYIDFDERQSNLFMSNKYFEILPNLKREGKLKSGSHISFAYAYIYFMTYMFRYTKYDIAPFRTGEVKKVLGYNENDKRVNYIMKDKGILDKENILETIYDFPIAHEYDKHYETLEFTMLSDLDDYQIDDWKKKARNKKFKLTEEEIQEGKKNIVTKNQYSKYPVLAFYDEIESYFGYNLSNEGGTFYNIYNTTNIPFEVFNYCMANDEIGCDGFYLYAFLKYKNNIFGNYNATYQRISESVLLSSRTVQKYIEIMRSYKVINTIHNMKYFSTAIATEDRKASTHKPNDFDAFSYVKSDYKKMEIVLRKDHDKRIVEENIKRLSHKLEIDEDSLPF